MVPVQTAPDGAIMLPETRASAAPAGADELSVRLGQVVIEGGDAALAADLAAVVGPLEGRQASKADRQAERTASRPNLARTGVRRGRRADKQENARIAEPE